MSGQPIATTLVMSAEDPPADRLAALFDAHHQRLYRLARRMTSSADDALDLVQETFLRVARAPKSVPFGSDREEAWLVRVLVNLCRDQWRKAAVQKRYDEPRPEVQVTPDHGPAVVARTTIWRALDILSPRRRAVVVMHELEGLAISTIASQLRISAITVRWHLSAGRRELTRVLTAPMETRHDKRIRATATSRPAQR
jgi:RNA polymerase sigma-70 factor, ECF subfamily